MSKKDYIALAALLRNANLSVVDEDGNPQAADIVMADLCHDMADMLAADNPRFDRQKFLSASGL